METTATVRNKVGDAVAEVAREYSDQSMLHTILSSRICQLTGLTSPDQQWPELLGVLFTLSNSKDSGQRENSYRIFATTPGIIYKQHEDTVLSAFTKGFKDEDVAVSIRMLKNDWALN